jgi:hypothetical protein
MAVALQNANTLIESDPVPVRDLRAILFDIFILFARLEVDVDRICLLAFD